MPKRPSFPISRASSRGRIPCSNHSPTSGRTWSCTNWRTVSRIAFSSSSSSASMARKSSGSSAVSLAVTFTGSPSSASGSRQQLPVPGKNGDELVDIVVGVVGVCGDAKVAVALRGDDAIVAEDAHQPRSIRRGDADEGAALLDGARRDEGGAELVDARDQALVEAVHVLARLGDTDLHQ